MTQTHTETETGTATDRFVAAIEAGVPVGERVFAADAVVDATVPNWRWTIRGVEAIRDTFAGWFADPGRFESLRRSPLSDGELLEFTLTWQENGVPHACHQAHRLTVRDGVIVEDTVYCGGRWNAALLAEMAEADRDSAG
ncbi:MAG TPA: hypothetical protein VH134_13805 [Candidatus Dormibacteraeota bacterium]|jgi:hypothetical protein|nr:hypothetical protein [Candidatus Dormibacteraeota bacterium]